MIDLDDLTAKVGAVKNGTGWTARCPAHADKKPSLSIGEGDDGRILLSCFAGCSIEEICKALSISVADLMPEQAGPSTIVARYPYRSAVGEVLYEVERHKPKRFTQRRPDGHGGWINNLDGVERVPYKLPELLAADPTKPVFVPEGEKDVDRLLGRDLVATTNSGGARELARAFRQAP